jgi:tripartite-type tricarboxylate transporter receptor subunit TctC
MDSLTRRNLLLSAAAIAVSANARATNLYAQGSAFSGKTATIIVGYAAGGGTDLTARLIAPYFTRLLPDSPTVLVQNMPGASGGKSMAFVQQKGNEDGLNLVMGAANAVDPLTYRGGALSYNPERFDIVGGFGRGGLALIASTEALDRLYDKAKTPVTMGAINPHDVFGRSGLALWGIECLGWNVKWVVGYPGTNETMIALDRGEIEMAVTGDLSKIKDKLNSGKMKVLALSGARSELPGVPLIADQVAGKIDEPLEKKAFAYWQNYNSLDKWLGVGPGAPKDMVAAYRAAFDIMTKDAEFIRAGRSMSEDFVIQSSASVSAAIKALADTPDEAIEFIKKIAIKQGLSMN